MIKATVKARGTPLGAVYPKLVFNPDAPSEVTVVYNAAEIAAAPEGQVRVLDPTKEGWSTTDNLLFGQSGKATHLYDWNRVSGGVTGGTSGWLTFTGTSGNGDNLYGSEITGHDVIDIPGPLFDDVIGIVADSDGELYFAGIEADFGGTGNE